jgi:hypothetical protein
LIIVITKKNIFLVLDSLDLNTYIPENSSNLTNITTIPQKFYYNISVSYTPIIILRQKKVILGPYSKLESMLLSILAIFLELKR